MIGILLVSLGAFMTELAESIGKDQVAKQKQTIYTMGFLSMFFGFVFFAILALWRGSFVFSLASLPTYSLRVVLEMFQAYVTMRAITTADRSTYGFLRTVTIPLLLLVDIALGYAISPIQLLGIVVIMCTLFFLLVNHGISRRGAGLTLITAINGVLTISLYKYNISHFNSVEAEQGMMYVMLMGYFLAGAYLAHAESPFRALRQTLPRLQSFTYGVAGIFESFAYTFAPASVITTGKRAAAVLWAILSGNRYFKEKRPVIKIIAFVAIVIGLMALLF